MSDSKLTQRTEEERRCFADEVSRQSNRVAHFIRVSTICELAAGIAAEINPSVAAIENYAKTCQRLVGNNDFSPQEIAATLDHIHAQALRVGEIIRRLRKFVASRGEPRREHVEANRLLEDALSLAQTEVRHHSIRMVMELSPQAPWVHADTVQIQQVILDLLHNSIDAMIEVPEERREIVLRTQVVSEGDVEFMVADRGTGIDAAIMAELFNQFLTTKAGGTGLGLPSSLSTLRAHGGRMWCDANPNGGARFFFTLQAVPVPT